MSKFAKLAVGALALLSLAAVGGIIVALATGLLGYLGGEFLEPLYVYALGTKWASSMLFDVGVYAAVLGLVMLAFNVLGADEEARR